MSKSRVPKMFANFHIPGEIFDDIRKPEHRSRSFESGQPPVTPSQIYCHPSRAKMPYYTFLEQRCKREGKSVDWWA